MRFSPTDRVFYALGVDVTAEVSVPPDETIDTSTWHMLFSGFEFVPVPASVHALWARARRHPVLIDDIEEVLASTQDRVDLVRLFTREAPVFVEWPWVNNGSANLSATELILVNTPRFPNPDPAVIPAALWQHFPSIADLEHAYQSTAHYALGEARWGLMEAIPDWLAAMPGLRLQLKWPPWLRMVNAGIDPVTGDTMERDALLRRYGVDPDELTRPRHGIS